MRTQEVMLVWLREDFLKHQYAKIIALSSKVGCTVLECCLNRLGNQNFMTIELEGKWNQFAELEIYLRKIKEEGVDLYYTRVENSLEPSDAMAYEFELITFNHPHTLENILNFLRQRGEIIKCHMRQFHARYTQGDMSIVQMVILIPKESSLSVLREQFSDFCDQNNFDAVLEPIKF